MTDTARLIIELPIALYDALAAKNPKGAEAAAVVALKTYLISGRPVKNAERDAKIFERSRQGVRQNAIAREFGLSLIRIQQIIANESAKRRNAWPTPDNYDASPRP
jgi:Mor family transcriptional regulator